MPAGGTGLAFAAALAAASPATAACPVELAIYRDRDGVAEIAFRPAAGSAAVTNKFQMAMRGGPLFEGVVMWTEEPARPYGQVMFNCPEGDVTGAELDACTLWQGVIYGVDGEGGVGLLPGEGEPAPSSIILSDLAYQMRGAPAFSSAGLFTVPSDVFALSGCQE